MLGKRRKKTDLPAVCAVIVAAGSSRRMGGENKLLLEIDGVPVLARTLSAFQKCAAIRDIVLVCREQDIMPYTELAKAFSIDKLCTVTRGGGQHQAHRKRQYRRRCRPRHACRGTDPAGIPQGPAPPCAHLGGRARLQLHR